MKFSEQNYKKLRKGSFSKKTQKIHTKFQPFATSGRHNYAMITDRSKFTTK